MAKEKANKDAGREAVKLRMEVVKRVRKNKEKTGVPIAVFFERAATEKLDKDDAYGQLLEAEKIMGGPVKSNGK